MTSHSKSCTRILRIAIVDGLEVCLQAVSFGVSGPLFDYFGFIPVFSTAAFLSFMGLLFISFVLKESLVKNNETVVDNNQSTCKAGILYAIEGIRTLFKPRALNRRNFLLLSMLSFTLCNISYNGWSGTQRFYFGRKKYKWTESELTLFSTIFR